MIRHDSDFEQAAGREVIMNISNRSNRPMTPEEAEAAESKRRREMLIGLFRGRWHWAILLALILGLAGAYAGYNSQGDEYEAGSGIEIRQNAGGVFVDDPLREKYLAYVNSEIRKMTSEEVISLAMSLPEWTDHLADRPDALGEMSTRDFAGSLRISAPGKDSTFVSIRFTSEYPPTASAGLNALMKAYKQSSESEQSSAIKVDYEVLLARRKELENKERLLLDDRALVMSDAEAETLRARLDQKLAELSIRERQFSEIVRYLAPLLDQEQNPTPRLIEELRRSDPEMLSLLNQKREIENRLSYLQEVRRLGDLHRDVQEATRALNQIDQRIVKKEDDWQGGLDQISLPVQIQDKLLEKQNLSLAISELESTIDDLSSKKSRLDRIDGQIATTRASILGVDQSIDAKQADDIDRTFADRGRIDLGAPAGTPTSPSNQAKRTQLAVLGGGAGVFTGFGLILLVGLMDRRLRHASDASLGMPDLNVLGILPTLPQNLNEPEEAETAAHCVHHIRTLLQIGGTNRVFSITSPAAGSGKSSLTSALGMSFASSGTKTLVIDCDLVGAGLSRRLGVVVHQPLEMVIRRHKLLDDETLDRAMMLATTRNQSLAEVLLDQGAMTNQELERADRLQRDTSLGILEATTPGRLRSCVARTEMDGLDVLPVGKAKPADASKLSPTAVRSLIQQAREEYDMVLIDTGPALGSLEASIAAAEADATVLVVSRGDEKSVTRKCVDLLESVHANITGVVFNHALDSDLAHTSYASAVSQDRRPDRSSRRAKVADLKRSARFGPLGSAVAAYNNTDEPDAAPGLSDPGESFELTD